MRRRLVRIGFLVFVGAWTVAIIYSVTAGGTSPERLADPEATTVESNCVTAQHDLERLPQLATPPTPAETATRLDREDEILSQMVERQRTVHPKHKSPAVALDGWLGDWQRLITARAHYAGDLRTKGHDARFIEPAYKGIDPIADKMDTWILEQGTRTENCKTGALQVEVVNGPRTYGNTK